MNAENIIPFIQSSKSKDLGTKETSLKAYVNLVNRIITRTSQEKNFDDLSSFEVP